MSIKRLKVLFESAVIISHKHTKAVAAACEEYEATYGHEPPVDGVFLSGIHYGEGHWSDVVYEEKSDE